MREVAGWVMAGIALCGLNVSYALITTRYRGPSGCSTYLAATAGAVGFGAVGAALALRSAEEGLAIAVSASLLTVPWAYVLERERRGRASPDPRP